MENMTSWEMRNKAKQMIHKKFGEPETEVAERNIVDYEEAKKAGNTKGMISSKLSAYRDGQTRSVRALAKEYMELPITTIQSNLSQAKSNLEKAKDIRDRQLKNEEARIRETYKNIPMHPARLEGHVAEDLEEFKRIDHDMIEALKDVISYRNEVDALEIAKQDYLDTNADLIAEERRRVEREMLYKSGLAEELGLTPPEEEPKEE